MNRKIRKPNNSPVQSETLSLIKQQFFKTKMCPFQKNKNYCLNESNCHYAHSLEELKPMPNLRNTKLCEYVKKKLPCQNPNCKFAHDIDMLKPSVHLATYKSAICSFWGKGKCFNGNKCRFAHGNEDMKSLDELNKTMNSIKTESTPNQASFVTPIHQKSRNGLKKKSDVNNNVGNLNGNTHSNPNMKGNVDTDLCNSSTNSFHTCEHFARGSAETTNAFGEPMKQEPIEEKINQESPNKDKWTQNRKNNNTIDIREGTNIWGTDEPQGAIGEELNEHKNMDYNKFIGEERFCDNGNNNNNIINNHNNNINNNNNSNNNSNNNNTNRLLTNTYAFYKNSMNNVNTTMHTKKNLNNLNRSNSNSMKDIIEKMENMKISSYLENSDNYTETIKYLVRENAKLKQSLRNDYCSVDMNIEKDFQNKNGKPYSLDFSAGGNNTCPIQMNCNDMTKYFYNDEKQTNERYLNNMESQNGNLMNVATFEDTSNGDENLCNIIKTIDDILISHNVDSFSNIKNENIDVRKDSSMAFENTKDTLQGNSNASEVFNGYENFFYNMKSFDTAKNDCSDSNSNSNSILTLEKKNSKDTDILEQLFQQSIQSDQLEKKKNYFYQDNNVHKINRTEDYFAKRKSFQQEEMQTKKYEEFFQKNNFKVHPFQQTIQQNIQHHIQPLSIQQNIPTNIKSNLDLQQSIHKFLQSEQNRKEEISYNRGDPCDMNQEEFMYMRNSGNPIQVYSHNMNQTQMFSQGMNQPLQNNPAIKNVYKEKNTKLNSTEQDNLLMNDTNLNTEKLFELFSDKTQLIKKLKIFLSTELKNSENQKYTSSTKINNFSNVANDNHMINTKNCYFNEPLYSAAFNNNNNSNNSNSNHINSNPNVNEMMNNNINYNNNNNGSMNMNMNMNRTMDMNSINNKYESYNNNNNNNNNMVSNSDMPLYEMEMNMDKNIWNHVNSNMNNTNMNTSSNNIKIKNNNNHSSSCNNIISTNFNNAQLNEYTHPNYSSEWINNNDNLDFFNLSKSINMSRLN